MRTQGKTMLQKSVLTFTSLAIFFSFAFLQAKEKEQLSEIPGTIRVQVEVLQARDSGLHLIRVFHFRCFMMSINCWGAIWSR